MTTDNKKLNAYKNPGVMEADFTNNLGNLESPSSSGYINKDFINFSFHMEKKPFFSNLLSFDIRITAFKIFEISRKYWLELKRNHNPQPQNAKLKFIINNDKKIIEKTILAVLNKNVKKFKSFTLENVKEHQDDSKKIAEKIFSLRIDESLNIEEKTRQFLVSFLNELEKKNFIIKEKEKILKNF